MKVDIKRTALKLSLVIAELPLFSFIIFQIFYNQPVDRKFEDQADYDGSIGLVVLFYILLLIAIFALLLLAFNKVRVAGIVVSVLYLVVIVYMFT